jgi:gamma-glutamyltranspeptidase/glutathione hydrolase
MKKYFLILFIIIQFDSFAQDRLTDRNFATRSEVIAGNGMVASSHPLATQIGLDI